MLKFSVLHGKTHKCNGLNQIKTRPIMFIAKITNISNELSFKQLNRVQITDLW